MFKLEGPGDERGISEVLGAILILGICIGVGSVIYAQYVQSSIHSSEASHMADVQSAFLRLKSQIGVTRAGDSGSVSIPMNPDFPSLVSAQGEVGTLSLTPGIAYIHAGSYTVKSGVGSILGSLDALKADDDNYLEFNQVISSEIFNDTSLWTENTVTDDLDTITPAFSSDMTHTNDGSGSIHVSAYAFKEDPSKFEDAYWERNFGTLLYNYPNVTLQAWFKNHIQYNGQPQTGTSATWRMDVENLYQVTPSTQTLYAHQENTSISGENYYWLENVPADNTGTNLSVSTDNTGRQLLGKFVYPLAGLSTIPASTWTTYYRSWYSAGVSDNTTKNSSSALPAVWTNPTGGYSSDNVYASSATDGQTQQYENYGFDNIPAGSTINKVEVGYEAYTSGNDNIGIACSWDNGIHWAKNSFGLPTSDPNTTTWADFTSATAWTPTTLSNANFQTRAKEIKIGTDGNPTNNPSLYSSGWTNAINAENDGGSYASITSGTPSASQTYQGYGFNIPDGSIIDSVRVRYDAWSIGSSGLTNSKNPTANTNGTNPWTNPAEGYTSNNSYATASQIYTYSKNPIANTNGTTPWTSPTNGYTSDNSYATTTAFSSASATRVPTSNGTAVGTWTPSTGANWSCVDETTPNDADYMTAFTNAGNNYQLFGFTAFSVPTRSVITDLTVYYRAMNTASNACNIRAVIYVNGILYFITDTGVDPSDSPTITTYNYKYTTNPNTGLAWTPAEINGTNGLTAFGVGSDDGNPDVNVYMVYAEVHYKTVATFDQIYGTFGFTGTTSVTKVEIGYEAFSGATGKLDLYTSTNGGSSWNTVHTTADLATSDPNSYTYVDVTSDASWTWNLLNDTNFKIKVISKWVSGDITWDIDALIVRVTVAKVAYDQIYGTFGLTGDGTITKVEVGYEAFATATGKLDLYTSSNGGSTWNAIHTTANLDTSDPDNYTYVDVTGDTTSWTWTLLNDSNLKVKVVTDYVSDTPAWSLDALVVRVTYNALNNEQIRVDVSWNGGTNWSSQQTTNLNGTEATYWYDVTGAISWTPAKLADGQLQVRADAYTVGSDAGDVRLDWIPVEVTYTAQDNVYLDYLPVRVTYTPQPVAHSNISILIRKSDNTIRQTIAENVADSDNITPAESTYSRTYSWEGYTVVNQSDYLEIDYYCHVTTGKSGGTAYLRIENETRVANVLLATAGFNWKTVLNNTVSLDNTAPSDFNAPWKLSVSSPIENMLKSIRVFMSATDESATSSGANALLDVWTDDISLMAGPPFLDNVLIKSQPIVYPENVDNIVVILSFCSKDSPASYTLQIENFSGNNWVTLKSSVVTENKVYWGKDNVIKNPQDYISSDGNIWLLITGKNDNTPFRMCLDYLNFQVNYKEGSENYLMSYYGASGKLTFSKNNYSYQDQTYLYDDGAVILAQGNSSIMVSEPTLVVVKPRDGSNIEVDVNHFVIKGSESSIARSGWSTVGFTVLGSYPTVTPGTGPGNENVTININTSPLTYNAWANYLSELQNRYGEYNVSWTPSGNTLTLVIKGLDNDSILGNDIYYSEMFTEVQVSLG